MANIPIINVQPARVSGYHLVKPGETLNDIRAQYGDDFLSHPHNVHHLGTGVLLPGMRLRV